MIIKTKLIYLSEQPIRADDKEVDQIRMEKFAQHIQKKIEDWRYNNYIH